MADGSRRIQSPRRQIRNVISFDCDVVVGAVSFVPHEETGAREGVAMSQFDGIAASDRIKRFLQVRQPTGLIVTSAGVWRVSQTGAARAWPAVRSHKKGPAGKSWNHLRFW